MKLSTAFASRIDQVARPLLFDAPHRVERVTLVVGDLGRMSDFYRSILGLEILERGPGRMRLGRGNQILLELEQDSDARIRSRSEAGLFHTAFLLPSRSDLGAWLGFAMKEGVRMTGAADHLVSEAVYLNDPEGNGIEIYVDRPDSVWATADGKVSMATDPLDLDGLVRSAKEDWSGFPHEGLVGHVHLQVGDLAEADNFYRDLLGFDISCLYPGANFYGSGGYHHQLAGNIWNSRGAPVRADRSTGLSEITLRVDEPTLDAVASRTRWVGSNDLRLLDPWGTAVRLRAD